MRHVAGIKDTRPNPRGKHVTAVLEMALWPRGEAMMETMSIPQFSIGLYGKDGKVLVKYKPVDVPLPKFGYEEGRVALLFDAPSWKVKFAGGRIEGIIIYVNGKEHYKTELATTDFKPSIGQEIRVTEIRIILYGKLEHECPLGGKW